VVSAVDRALLVGTMRLRVEEVTELRDWATVLRVRRTRQTETNGSIAEA
jgi:hypothetical protein